MPMKPVVVVGHAALDRVYRIAAFPAKPTKVRALEHVESGGGTAANAAAAIGRLGGPVELWSRTGDDPAGAAICRLLVEDGVDVAHVLRHAGSRSATAAVIVDAEGERLIVSERDHAMPMGTGWLPLEHVAEAGAVLSDLSWIEATVAAFERARPLAIPTLVDADVNSTTFLARALPLTDYAICSQGAMEVMVPDASTGERLQYLLDHGATHAGITLGAAGYAWRTRQGDSGLQPAFEVPVVDTTGAGDAFHGAFAWSRAQGLADADCARIASAAAALKCRALGARGGLATRFEVDAFLRRQGIAGIPPHLLAGQPH